MWFSNSDIRVSRIGGLDDGKGDGTMKLFGHYEILKATKEETRGMCDYQYMRVRQKVSKKDANRVTAQFLTMVVLAFSLPILMVPVRMYATAYAPWMLVVRPFTQEIFMGVLLGLGVGVLMVSSYRPLDIKMGEKYVGDRFLRLLIQLSAIRTFTAMVFLFIGVWAFINANIGNGGEAFGFFCALTVAVFACLCPSGYDLNVAYRELIRRRRK